VANCDKWPVYKGRQHCNFHCTSWKWTALARPSYFASRRKIYGTQYTESWAGHWNCVNMATKKNRRPVFSVKLRHAYESTRRSIPENMNFQQHRFENLTRRKIVVLPLPAFKFPWPTPYDGHYSDWATPSSYAQLHSPHFPYLAITRAKYARFDRIVRADKNKYASKMHHAPVCCGRSVLLPRAFIWMQDMNECMPNTDGTPWSNTTYMTMSYH
jgi:hypothetical protein